MDNLGETIIRLIERGKYVIGLHASERLEERGIMEWQIVAGMDEYEIISERPDDEPNPSVEFRVYLPDGTDVKAVWSILQYANVAKLVTVHYFDKD